MDDDWSSEQNSWDELNTAHPIHHDTARCLLMSIDALKHTPYTTMQLDASRCL